MDRKLLVLSLLLTLVATACGGDDGGEDATRTIEVDMVDIAFEPSSIDVEAGETVRFVFSNEGEAVHEGYLGDEQAQEEHDAERSGDGHDGEEMQGMEHGGDEEAVVVDPGDTGELTYTFEEPGQIQIGCHQPGHYEAGMVIDVNVT